MIVVIGRPGLAADGELAGTSARVALAAAGAGARVELAGSVGDDQDGDAVAVALGRAGIGHAALLRDPVGLTVRGARQSDRPLPRLDAADLQLALEYLPECRVLVVADPLEPATLRVAAEAARYHRAHSIFLVPPGHTVPEGVLPERATVLETPDEDGGAFAVLVGRYAAELAAGRDPTAAWVSAVRSSGWEEQSVPEAGEAR